MLKPTAQVPDFHLHHDASTTSFDALHHPISRRRALEATILLAGAAMGGLVLPAFAQKASRKVTPLQTIGPFYPIDVPADQDADLTLINGHKDRAQGTILYVSGRVLNPRGEPVANAALDIWQANAGGRYAHPADENKAPLDANFQGFARIRASADGSYSFKTIKPGAYPTGVDNWTRPPHIHFDVSGKYSRAVTQMYFEDDPFNAKDRLLNQVPDKETLIARPAALGGAQEKGALALNWDIVLVAG